MACLEWVGAFGAVELFSRVGRVRRVGGTFVHVCASSFYVLHAPGLLTLHDVCFAMGGGAVGSLMVLGEGEEDAAMARDVNPDCTRRRAWST